MTTTSIIFDRKGKAGKNGEGMLELRLTHERKSCYFSTGIKVKRNQWEYDRIVRHTASDELNERLGIFVRRIMAEVNKYLKNGRALDFASIRVAITGKVEADMETVAEWVKEQTKMLDVAEGTRKHYRTLHKRLVEFGNIIT